MGTVEQLFLEEAKKINQRDFRLQGIESKSYPALSFYGANVINGFPIIEVIGLDKVLVTMRQLYSPLFGEFIEDTRNPAWAEISNMFLEALLLNEKAYLDYDKELNRFEVYTKVVPNSPDDKRFYRVRDNKTLIIPFPDLLASCSWDGLKDMNRFNTWFEIAHTYANFNRMIEEQITLASKKVTLMEVESTDPNYVKMVQKFQTDLLDGQLTINKPYELMINPNPLINLTDLESFRRCVQGWLDVKLSELGLVRNRHMKGARLTAGENFTSTHSSKCLVNNRFNQLLFLSSQISKLWGIDLDFITVGDVEPDLHDSDTVLADNTITPSGNNAQR